MVALLKMPRPSGYANAEERRVFPRKDVQGEVQANRVDHTIVARRQPRVMLELRDLSLGGMSAISPLPLECGERLWVRFPRLGSQAGWDAVGRVSRCVPGALGYRVALEFDPLPAA